VFIPPPTFRDGANSIDAVYATTEIECVNAFILPHKGGIGDHWCFIFNFTSSLFIGTKFPNIVQCAGRRFHCKSTCLVQMYNHKLDALCNQHKMHKRIYFIYLHLEDFSDDDFVYLMNGLDTKLTQLKLHSEKNCPKFKNCNIELSPKVGFWLSGQWLLTRVKRIVLGLGTPDPCNLIRDYFRAHLFDPRSVSDSEVMIHIQIMQHQSSQLAKDTPALQCKHLLDLWEAADDCRDFTSLAVILEVLTHKQEWKKLQQINYTTCPPQGRAPIAI
jgi:hypothetical protein